MGVIALTSDTWDTIPATSPDQWYMGHHACYKPQPAIHGILCLLQALTSDTWDTMPATSLDQWYMVYHACYKPWPAIHGTLCLLQAPTSDTCDTIPATSPDQRYMIHLACYKPWTVIHEIPCLLQAPTSDTWYIMPATSPDQRYIIWCTEQSHFLFISVLIIKLSVSVGVTKVSSSFTQISHAIVRYPSNQNITNTYHISTVYILFTLSCH